jgi:hypothetical protein
MGGAGAKRVSALLWFRWTLHTSAGDRKPKELTAEVASGKPIPRVELYPVARFRVIGFAEVGPFFELLRPPARLCKPGQRRFIRIRMVLPCSEERT